VGAEAVQVVEVFPHHLLLAAEDVVPHDEAAGGAPHPHHVDPAEDDLCVGAGVLFGEHGFEGAAHGSCSS